MDLFADSSRKGVLEMFRGSQQRRIRGIVDELVANSLDAGAKNIKTEIRHLGDCFEITVEDDGRGMGPEVVRQVQRLLSQPRRDELEEYYGDLAGVSEFASGLNTVGFMVDEAEVTSHPGKGTKVTVKRICSVK